MLIRRLKTSNEIKSEFDKANIPVSNKIIENIMHCLEFDDSDTILEYIDKFWNEYDVDILPFFNMFNVDFFCNEFNYSSTYNSIEHIKISEDDFKSLWKKHRSNPMTIADYLYWKRKAIKILCKN